MRMQNAVVALAAVVALSATASAQVVFPVAQPAVKVGDRWKYLTLDGISKLQEGWREETVVDIGAEAILASVQNDAGRQPSATYDRDWNTLADLHGKVERQVKLSFPLELAKQWESKYGWINSRGHSGLLDLKYKVQGIERIATRAGSFDAVVIDGYGSWHNTTTGTTGVAVEKIWYAPAARRSVKRTWLTRFADGRADLNVVFEASEVELK